MSLELYTYGEFLTDNNTQQITAKLAQGGWKEIGKGAIGTIYAKGYKVIKKASLCAYNPDTRHCRLATVNDLVYVYRYPSKHFILVPDFIIELEIGKEMTKLLKSGQLIGVPEVYNQGINFNRDPTVYVEMKKYDELSWEYSDYTEEKIAFRVFQIMISIILLQYFMRFTHYDLHWGNIMSTYNPNTCVHIPNTVFVHPLYFPPMIWPVLVDFGTSIFSKTQNGFISQYINTSNNDAFPKDWIEFNQYFDGLTLIKSIEILMYKKTGEQISVFERYPKLVSCFFKSNYDPREYYTIKNYIGYRPNIKVINSKPQGLFTPLQVLDNIKNIFGNSPSFNTVIWKLNEIPCSDVGNIENLKYPPIPIDPILNQNQLPSIPFTDIKQYYMNFKQQKGGNWKGDIRADIKVLQEIESANIFSFSLFASPTYAKAIYRYFYDHRFELVIGTGKNGDDAFYRHYLENQLKQCFSLINNDSIAPNSPGNTLEQWGDYGTLMIVDEHVLSLPMFVNENGKMLLWNKITKQGQPIADSERKILAGLVRKQGVTKIMSDNNIGTVGDYIKDLIKLNIHPDKRYRFGLYSYRLNDKFIKPLLIPITSSSGDVVEENVGITITTGMLGSVVRFMPLQDPRFNNILFRDAHSTMPNRNYVYDRQWHDTWQTTDKRIWFYHGAFYNPPHMNGMKALFAATWGARKIQLSNNPIFSPEEFNIAFGFESEDSNLFYGKTGYGVDERLLYRLTNSSFFRQNTYLVGMTHIIYLVAGQDNPRNFKIFENIDTGIIPTPEDLVNIDPKTLDINGSSHICRKLDFIMPSYSIYTDMRCVFYNAISEASKYYKIPDEMLTGLQFFEWLDAYLSSTGDDFMTNMLKMLPPRWNLWQYLFGNTNVDEEYILNRILEEAKYFGVNTSTICKINKYLWTGNEFNFDRYFHGNETILPSKVIVPYNYPCIKNVDGSCF